MSDIAFKARWINNITPIRPQPEIAILRISCHMTEDQMLDLIRALQHEVTQQQWDQWMKVLAEETA